MPRQDYSRPNPQRALASVVKGPGSFSVLTTPATGTVEAHTASLRRELKTPGCPDFLSVLHLSAFPTAILGLRALPVKACCEVTIPQYPLLAAVAHVAYLPGARLGNYRGFGLLNGFALTDGSCGALAPVLCCESPRTRDRDGLKFEIWRYTKSGPAPSRRDLRGTSS